MPLWLERFFIEHPLLVWVPLVMCVGGAAWLWWWQSNRRTHSGAAVVRVGWFGGVGTVAVVVGGIALAGYSIGLWSDVWKFVNERPSLVAWWMAAVGATVIVWGVAVHAWRGEVRLSRQCRKCGYDMTGVAGLMTCPECGRVAKSEWQLRPRNVRRAGLWAGGLVIVLSGAMPIAVNVAQRGPAGVLSSRTLIWWVSTTSAAPSSVMTETLRRSTEWEEGFAALRQSNADQLADRLLETQVGFIEDYVKLLEQVDVSERVQLAAVAQMNSSDAVRRWAAVRLLCAAPNPVEIDPQLILKWESDTDPRVARWAGFLRQLQANAAYQRLESPGGGIDKMEFAEIRLCLRQCTSFEHPLPVFGRGAIPRLTGFSDPEISARATCLAGAAMFDKIEFDADEFVRMMRAKERLDQSSPGSGPVWASAGYWLLSRQGRGAAFVVSLASHPDPAVRELLVRQCQPSGVIGAKQSWSGLMPAWRAVLPAFEDRLRVEENAGVRAELSTLIEEIKGQVPAGFTP